MGEGFLEGDYLGVGGGGMPPQPSEKREAVFLSDKSPRKGTRKPGFHLGLAIHSPHDLVQVTALLWVEVSLPVKGRFGRSDAGQTVGTFCSSMYTPTTIVSL